MPSSMQEQAAADDAEQLLRRRQQRSLLRHRTMWSLSAGVCLQFTTAMLVQQAQIAIGLKLSGGDRGVVITRMAQMQSTAAALQFFVNPLVGRLSDAFGRKPLLVGSNAAAALLRLTVVLFPSWLTLTLIKVAGMNCSNAFRTSVDASLSDLFEVLIFRCFAVCAAVLTVIARRVMYVLAQPN
jgi:MFS family permease